MAYAVRSDVEAFYGPRNVERWADLDEDQDPAKIAARIEAALAWATSEIDDHLRGGPYPVPFVLPAPATIVDLCAKLAGAWLYASRGAQDMNPQTGEQLDRLSAVRNDVYAKLRKLHAGVIRLDVTMRESAPSIVHVKTTADETEDKETYDGFLFE